MIDTDIPIIILAAGASSRMRGRDKLLEEVDSQPLIRRQAALARSVTRGRVIVALPCAPHPRYDALGGIGGVTALPVPDANEGISASLRTTFASLPPGTLCAMLMLADMPDLTQNDLKVILQAVTLKPENTIWRGATKAGKPGHPIVFSATWFPAIATLKGDEGGREITRQAKGKTALIPLPDSDARADLDTPEDWAEWHANRAP